MKYDTIIIGAGLGGLTAGAKLAKEGKKVLVIEQHDKPGGCATTFKRKVFTMEVGLHEMDGLDAADMKTKVFNDLGVFDEVEFLKLPEFYRFIQGDYQFTMPHNPEKAMADLIADFPAEEEGIKTYFAKLAEKPMRRLPDDHVELSVGEYLDSIINNDTLKLVLLGNLGYFHDDPYTLSLSYYAVAQGSYFRGGGNFIKAGSQKLSDYLASFIEKNGGKVLLKHMAKEILVKDNKAAGVRYYKNSTPDDIIEDYADDVIANNSLPGVASMLPEEYGNLLSKQFNNTRIGASLLTLYLGFKKPLKEIGSKYYSYFLYDESVKTQTDILGNNKGSFEKRSFTFVDYSQVDSALAPEGKSVGSVCCIDYPEDWENLSTEEYKNKKEEVAQIFIGKLDKLIPGLSDQIEYYEVGTSLTVGRYILTPQSAVYGFAQTPEYFMKPKIETLENLHFASAWTKIGGGFSGAIFSGYMCAFGMLRRR
ncbi:MAG: NAD(P)/FAD-dependent oxidoreductase [Bacteroidales bacterium]|nr:NAD(P)/FAD-dependent oxidoreductase [Bacteroidales bacterium]MBN2819927.1 NAD(P)/FAD-dependent oxidoreductase [Bacteroidales bacterium]